MMAESAKGEVPAVKVGAKTDRTRHFSVSVARPTERTAHGVMVLRNNYTGRAEAYSLRREDWDQLHRAVGPADREHAVHVDAAKMDALRHWLENPDDSCTAGGVTFEAVAGGGILVRTRPYAAHGEPQASPAASCLTGATAADAELAS